MKKTLLLLVAAALVAGQARATNATGSLPASTRAMAVSPSGRYVVGYNYMKTYDDLPMESYILDRQSGEVTWKTTLDASDYSKGGSFASVTDGGMVLGTVKDLNHTFVYSGITTCANCVAVWDATGKRTLLPYGSLDTIALKKPGDGMAAVSLSADGKVAAGNLAIDYQAFMYPCKWTQDADGNWMLQRLAIPDDGSNGAVADMSGDGKVLAGTYRDIATRYTYAIVWTPSGYTALTPDKLTPDKKLPGVNMRVLDLSDNGKYLLINENWMGLTLYNVETGQARSLGIENSSIVRYARVDNEGNVYGVLRNNSFWYCYKENRTLSMDYYFSVFAPELKLNGWSSICAISADGSTIVGDASWVHVERDDQEIPAKPAGLKAKSQGLHEVTVSWNKDKTSYRKLSLKRYNVYRDGQLVKSLAPGAGDVITLDESGLYGHPVYSVQAVYSVQGGDSILSPESDNVTASIPENYDFPFFDDFDNNAPTTVGYWVPGDDQRGSESTKMWTTTSLTDLGTRGSSLYCTVDRNDGVPYSCTLETRPIDATGKSRVAVSFAALYGFVNVEGQCMDNDSVAIDLTTDYGKTWTTEKAWSVQQLTPMREWNMVMTDISAHAAGRIFQLRLRRYGQGNTEYYLCVDNFKVGDFTAPAPTGVTGKMLDASKARLIWNDPTGAYALDYIESLAIDFRTIGNEGKEVIGAIKFDPADLALYNGKYLTGVTTQIFYNEDYKGAIPTDVVVYQDGKLVREQAVDTTAMPLNRTFTVKLNEPLKIDSTKTLMVGLRVHDYDSHQMPLLYNNPRETNYYVTGKSDLYSEDGGKTWLTVHDFFASQGDFQEQFGRCVWYIIGEVTDQPYYTPGSENVVGYSIYRNGEQCSTRMMDPYQSGFTDLAAEPGAQYQVVAYYKDGQVSGMSDAFTLRELTGVTAPVAPGLGMSYDPEAQAIELTGEWDSATVVSLSGAVVASCGHGGQLPVVAGLARGVYVVVVKMQNGTTVSKKILIN